MPDRIAIVAQLSSVHSPDAELAPAKVAAYLDTVTREVPLDSLAVGWTERPELFRMLTASASRPAPEVFLWYPLLSDYPGFDPSHLVVNSRSARSAGWSGYQGTGIAETFRQACPNNPLAFSTSLARLQDIMARYPFDGVFLDKIRFPSPANGLSDVFSCFCPHCVTKAAEAGLDLEAVRAMLNHAPAVASAATPVAIPPGARWLERLLADEPLLQRFIRFRADSISALVERVTQAMRAMGRKVSLDVFTPMLAPLVGQDIAALAPGADWIKPMIYRFGRGPANLRSELPTLLRDLARYLGRDEAAAMDWAAGEVDGIAGHTLAEIEMAAPLSLVRAETKRALALYGGTPLYLGLESVSIPGAMKVTPHNIEEMLQIGAEAGVQGYVLSWDLLHTPIENVRPLKTLSGR